MLDVFRERSEKVALAIGELSSIAHRMGATSIEERVERDLVRKLSEDRFHLVVVGEFNHGKSTFVNALLGETVLPAGVTPTTAAIHHICYAETARAEVVRQGGARTSIPFEDARGFSVGGGSDTEGVDYLEIGYPSPLLRERILLVDTPGVNDLSLQRADITYSYIPKCDAVLFLLDAGQILKESERVFLQDKLLKASRDKIIFVISKWDILSPEERVEAFAYAKEQLSRLVKDPVIFPISAEAALSGRPKESGLPELVSHLTAFLAEERGKILLDNALGEALLLAALLEKGLDAQRQVHSMQTEEIDRRIGLLEKDLAGQAGTIEQRRSQIREEIAAIKAGARKDLERFSDELSAKVPDIVDMAKAADLKQYLPAFLEDAFRNWTASEMQDIAAQLEILAEKTIALVKDDAAESNKRVAEMLGTSTKGLNVEVNTFAYDVGVAALLFGGLTVMMFVNVAVGGALALAAPVVAVLLRGRVEEEFRRRAKEEAPLVIRKVAEKIGPKIDEIVDEFAAKLDAWVVSAGEELHREILEVLRASRGARSSVAQSEQEAIAATDAEKARLTETRSRLEQVRSGLWTSAQTPTATE